MNAMKEMLSTIILILLETVVGILLLLKPVGFTTSIIVVFGVLLTLRGLAGVVKYFRTEPAAAQGEQTLFRGLTASALGVFCIARSSWFIAAFPVLAMLYGTAILVTGIYKLQQLLDMLRQHKDDWGLVAASAALAIVFAVVILLNPFSTNEMLWTFTAIALITEAALDIARAVILWRKNTI